jgi:hypothetical protein
MLDCVLYGVFLLPVVVPSGLTAVLCSRWSAAMDAAGVPCPMYRVMSAGFLGGLIYQLVIIMEMRALLASRVFRPHGH